MSAFRPLPPWAPHPADLKGSLPWLRLWVDPGLLPKDLPSVQLGV